jgi:hypothetical protein
VEQAWEARSEVAKRSRAADAAAMRAAEARLSEARRRAAAAEQERRARDAAIKVKYGTGVPEYFERSLYSPTGVQVC